MSAIPQHEAIAMLPQLPIVPIKWQLASGGVWLAGNIEIEMVRDGIVHNGARLVPVELADMGALMCVDFGWGDVYVLQGTLP